MPEGQTTSYELVPKGKYCLRVTDCVERSRKDDATKLFWVWSFEVLDDGEHLGETVSVLTPTEMKKGLTVEKIWLACGQPELPVKAPFNTDTLIGCEFYAQVVIKAAKGTGRLFNDFESVQSIEEFEKEMSKFISRRSTQPAHQAGQEEQEEQLAEEEVPPARPASAATTARPASPAPAARPASAAAGAQKPLSFPQRGGGLKK